MQLQSLPAFLKVFVASRLLASIAVVIFLSGTASFGQQSVPVVPAGPLPTDVTPIRLREERELFRPGPTFYLFKHLPANMWVNATTETNLRFESNIFLNANQPKRDLVYRALPNLTVGYNLWKNTGFYTNYFVIKDVYADTTHGAAALTNPTTQSLSLGFRHSRVIKRTNVQFDVQARELWQNKGLRQFDYLPGLLLTRAITPRTYGFVNLQLQMRGGTPFVAPTRELDPFYTVGILRSLGAWTLTVTDTFITNFRNPPFSVSIPQHGNAEMISDFEVYRPLTKRYTNLVGFVRAEPIWNWHSDRAAGLSGFDFRLYTGVRIGLYKQPIGSSVEQLRQELRNGSNKKPIENTPATPPGASPTAPSGNTDLNLPQTRLNPGETSIPPAYS